MANATLIDSLFFNASLNSSIYVFDLASEVTTPVAIYDTEPIFSFHHINACECICLLCLAAAVFLLNRVQGSRATTVIVGKKAARRLRLTRRSFSRWSSMTTAVFSWETCPLGRSITY